MNGMELFMERGATMTDTIERKRSYRASSSSRSATDFFQTPVSITRHLLNHEQFRDPILEPAAGDGAIARAIDAAGYYVEAYDLFRGENRGDFLIETRRFQSIITNPPFKASRQFLLKSFEVATEKIALIMPLDYLHGQQRFDEVWMQRKPDRVYVLVRRPLFKADLRLDGRYETGSTTFAWYVFDMMRDGKQDPRILWIDNRSDIVKSNRRRSCERDMD